MQSQDSRQQIHDAIVAECEARDLKVTVIPVGCVGYCAREVIIDIKLPGRPRISYCEVKPQEVITDVLASGLLLHDRVLKRAEA